MESSSWPFDSTKNWYTSSFWSDSDVFERKTPALLVNLKMETPFQCGNSLAVQTDLFTSVTRKQG